MHERTAIAGFHLVSIQLCPWTPPHLPPSSTFTHDVLCCTTSVSGYQRRLLLTSPRRLMQVYLTLPLTGKQPHDLPPLREAFVCPHAALATCISTGDLRLEIACVACVDPALHDAWAGYMVVPPCSTSRSQSYSQSFGKNARQRIAPGFGLLLHGMSHSGPYTAAHSINAAGKVALDGPYCWTCDPGCLVVGVLSGVRCCFMSFLNRLIVERYHISTPPSSNTARSFSNVDIIFYRLYF